MRSKFALVDVIQNLSSYHTILLMIRHYVQGMV